jgi:hypothetical protein
MSVTACLAAAGRRRREGSPGRSSRRVPEGFQWFPDRAAMRARSATTLWPDRMTSSTCDRFRFLH